MTIPPNSIFPFSFCSLMYFANPLFTVHSLIDYRSIGYDNRTELSWAHELHDNKNIVSASMKTLQSMTQHGLEITRLLLENIYDVRLLNHVSSINSIINKNLYTIFPQVNKFYPQFINRGTENLITVYPQVMIYKGLHKQINRLYVLVRVLISMGSAKTVVFAHCDCGAGKFNNLCSPCSSCVCSSAS